MGLQDGLNIRDVIVVELVDCPVPTPEPPAATAPIPAAPDTSPTTRAAEATIEQTGAGPPPED